MILLLIAATRAATHDITATLAAQTPGHEVTRPLSASPGTAVGIEVPAFGLDARVRPFDGATGLVIGAAVTSWATLLPEREPEGWSFWEVQALGRIGFLGIPERLGQPARVGFDCGIVGGVSLMAPRWFPVQVAPNLGTYAGFRAVVDRGDLRPVVAVEGVILYKGGEYLGSTEGTEHDIAFSTNIVMATARIAVGVEWGGRGDLGPDLVERRHDGSIAAAMPVGVAR